MTIRLSNCRIQWRYPLVYRSRSLQRSEYRYHWTSCALAPTHVKRLFIDQLFTTLDVKGNVISCLSFALWICALLTAEVFSIITRLSKSRLTFLIVKSLACGWMLISSA